MFHEHAPLIRYSNYKIGGPARYFYAGKKVEDIIAAVEKARQMKLPIFILGGGTNLLISDNGFNGLVLKPEILGINQSSAPTPSDRGSDRSVGDVRCQPRRLLIGAPTVASEVSGVKHGGEVLLKVGAGVPMGDLLQFTISKSLSGFEWAGGLPGTVGGAVRGNAGAFGGEIKDTVAEVISLDISGRMPKIVKRSGKQCRFGYRNSIFKENDGREIVLEAVFNFKKGDRKAIKEAIEEKIRYREERQPLNYPNIGSIFKNVDLRLVSKKLHASLAHVIKKDPFPVVPTAYLVSETGLKGIACGGAIVSPKHPNFIVNSLGAKADDVKQLINLVKSEVYRKFKIKLEEEIVRV